MATFPTKSELKRWGAVARELGLRNYRIEFEPTNDGGKISLVALDCEQRPNDDSAEADTREIDQMLKDIEQ